MAKKPQGKKERGSQKWIQVAVNERPDLLNRYIQESLGPAASPAIQWKSPLKEDDYAEYSDQDALEKLRLEISRGALTEFWPERGPNWDALGVTDSGPVFLVEAKSHINELKSVCGAKGKSLLQIEKALALTRDFLDVRAENVEHRWLCDFYQYANRLAHLYFLREINHRDVYMVFVYFVNDTEMGGPSTIEEWKGAIRLVESLLGVHRHKLSQYIGDVFISVDDLTHATTPLPVRQG